MKRLFCLFLLGLLLVSGCGRTVEPKATPVTVSLDYSVWDAGRLHQGRTVKLKASARTIAPVSMITITFIGEGSIEAVDQGQPAVGFKDLPQYGTAKAWGEFRTNGTFGPGTAIVRVEVREYRREPRTENARVVFYVTPEEVLAGGDAWVMKLQHLDHLLERGVLTPTQHKKEVLNMSRVPPVPSRYLP